MLLKANPVLASILDSAVQATGAAHGWLAVQRRDDLVVTAVHATPKLAAGDVLGAEVGSSGYVVRSGQAVAVAHRGNDARFGSGVADLIGNQPTSVLCVPCNSEARTWGAIELINHPDGRFSFDDVELITLLGGIAGVAVEHSQQVGVEVPSPRELMRDLATLSDRVPNSYAVVAGFVRTLNERV